MVSHEPGLYADHANSLRQALLQVHEDPGPRKSALSNQGVEERSPVSPLGNCRLVEKLFQGASLSLQDVHFVLEAHFLRPEGFIRSPSRIGMPGKEQHGDQTERPNGRRPNGEAPVALERLSGQIKADIHFRYSNRLRVKRDPASSRSANPNRGQPEHAASVRCGPRSRPKRAES